MINNELLNGKRDDSGKADARYFFLKEYVTLVDSKYESMATLIEKIGLYLRQDKSPFLVISLLHTEIFKHIDFTEAVAGVCRVSKLGAVKYGIYNYRKGLTTSRIYNALCRHFIKYFQDNMDEESGENHMYHILSNVYMLVANLKNNDMVEESNEPK